MTRKKRGDRPTIGVLAGWQFYWTATPLSYLDPLYRGVRQAAAHHGCNLLLGCGMGPSAASSDPMRPAWPVASAEADFVPIGPWNTDGLIAVNPLHSAERSRYMQAVRDAGHPVVFVGSGEKGPTIVADNAGGIHAAVRHLVDHGRRQIAFIAGSPDDMAGDTGARFHAFVAALRAFDLRADARRVAYGHHIFAGGQRAMQQIMEAGAPFTAVLASNDESALGAMQALRAAGYAIPSDVALIGFDDRPESAVQLPPLASVHLPLFQMGVQAVELLMRQIDGLADLPGLVTVGTRLVPRASCGCGSRRLVAAEDERSGQGALNDHGIERERLAQAMSAVVLAEAQALNTEDVHTLCRHLLTSFAASAAQADPTAWAAALDELLERTVTAGDDAQIWQPALSIVADGLSHFLPTAPSPTDERHVAALLDDARAQISETMWRQHRQFVIGERWTMDRIGLLTANLLTARDERQVFEMLAQHLPAMDIDAAWLAEFDTSEDAALPVAEGSTLRSLTLPQTEGRRFPTYAFPPASIAAGHEPFSLALLPLVGPRGQHGYVAFDSGHLLLYGAIVQQMAAALNSAQLYREATEGRRLAEEANQMKSRFLSTVSHELRTPLNLIVGTSGILLQESEERGTPLPDQMQRDITRIYSSAQHLTGLIGDVLDLASSDAGQLRLVDEVVELGQVLRLVEETGRRLAADKGLAWHADLPAFGPWVHGDRTRLRQVALNLVSNAVKFTARGSVSLRVESTASHVTVTVQDTGIGIPPEEQAAIFDEFRRTERSITQGYGGLGLGLAIAQRLVDLHGGTIGLRSSGEDGAGTTVFFTLPTVAAPVTGALPPAAPPAAQARGVLVLATQTAAPDHLADHLTQRGFKVQVAYLDATADWLARLAGGHFSAVILDISDAPELGWRALKAIKENPATQDLPALFYTAARPGGAVLELDYLTKPIEVTDLTRALDEHWLAADGGRPSRVILVVDDDPETLEMHARIVQAQSSANRIVRARNGREAMDVLQRVPVDLVLLDLTMPELDGFGVLERMRANPATRDVPVVVVTGQTLTEAEMARLNQGVASVMSKGLYSLDETLAHLDAALERRHKLSNDAQRLVRRAMAYLHEHYAEPLTRAEIAQHVGLDEDYLTYCFRQELGVTPIAYLNRYRVNQAKALLTQSDKSVTFIAQEVGFADSRYFSRIFRREVGVSPDAYRRT